MQTTHAFVTTNPPGSQELSKTSRSTASCQWLVRQCPQAFQICSFDKAILERKGRSAPHRMCSKFTILAITSSKLKTLDVLEKAWSEAISFYHFLLLFTSEACQEPQEGLDPEPTLSVCNPGGPQGAAHIPTSTVWCQCSCWLWPTGSGEAAVSPSDGPKEEQLTKASPPGPA